MEKRQNGHTTILPNGDVYGSDSSGGGTDIPTYVWIVVVIFLAFAVTCGICARRNYRRQYLFREDLLRNRPPTVLPFTRVGRPVFDPNTAGGGILRPPRAHRRGSQTSVTSLPVYHENPGEREVVLLQRTGPKEDERHSSGSPPPPASPTQATVPIGTYPPPPSGPAPPTNVNAATPNTNSEPRPSEPTTTSNQPLEPPGLERAASTPAPDTTAPGASDPLGRRSPPPAWSSTNPFANTETR